MKKILAFGASNSRKSINNKFASYAAGQLKDVEVTLADLNDFELPLYGIDYEKEHGIPAKVVAFTELLAEQDGLLISFAEHNSNYTVAFKNLLDWMSRIRTDVWQNKPAFFLSTSPGGRGGANVMHIALTYLPFLGGNIIAHFSLPGFHKNFNETEGITEPELRSAFEEQLSLYQAHLSANSQPSNPS